MKQIDYVQIIKDSASITWRHKFLWYFGAILAIGGGSGNLYFPSGSSDNDDTIQPDFIAQKIESFIAEHFELVIAVAVAILSLVILLVIFKTISQAGLIRSINNIEQGKNTGFMLGMGEGKKSLWKMLFLRIGISISIITLLIIIALPVIILIIKQAYISAVFVGLLALAIFFCTAVILGYISQYAIFYIVLSNLNIRTALEHGYIIFKKNILESIVMSLVLWPASMLTFGALLIINVAVISGAILSGILLYAVLDLIGIIITAIIGGLLLLILNLLIGAVFSVFYQTNWVLFFRKIAIVEESPIQVAEKVITEKNNLEPESAMIKYKD